MSSSVFTWSKASLAAIVGMAGLSLAHSGAARASYVIDNFSQDTVGNTTPSDVGAWNGQTFNIVSSGTADGNMLQVTVPTNSQYYAVVQIQGPGSLISPTVWSSYQDISFDLLFPTGYPGTNLTLSSVGWQGSGGNASFGLSPNINTTVPAANQNSTLVNVSVPLSGITTPPSGQTWMQELFNLYPNWDNGTSGPWTFDLGNIQLTNPVSTPEPASLAMLGISGAALLLIGRRRRLA